MAHIIFLFDRATLAECFLNLPGHLNHLRNVSKTDSKSPFSGNSDSVGLWGPRTYFYDVLWGYLVATVIPE